MFKPGDLVKIKTTDEVWSHLTGKMGIFLFHDETENKVLTNTIRLFHSELKIKFATEDLELICPAKDIKAIWDEEAIIEKI